MVRLLCQCLFRWAPRVHVNTGSLIETELVFLFLIYISWLFNFLVFCFLRNPPSSLSPGQHHPSINQCPIFKQVRIHNHVIFPPLRLVYSASQSTTSNGDANSWHPHYFPVNDHSFESFFRPIYCDYNLYFLYLCFTDNIYYLTRTRPSRQQ